MQFLLGLVVAAAAWYFLEHTGWPSGHGPFDALPTGLGARTGPVRMTAPTSGLIYDTYTYPTAQPTVTYNVAALTSGLGWLSFWNDSSSGARTPVASYVAMTGTPAPPALAVLQKDFNLS